MHGEDIVQMRVSSLKIPWSGMTVRVRVPSESLDYYKNGYLLSMILAHIACESSMSFKQGYIAILV